MNKEPITALTVAFVLIVVIYLLLYRLYIHHLPANFHVPGKHRPFH